MEQSEFAKGQAMMPSLSRWNSASVVLGVVVWIVGLGIPPFIAMERLFLFGVSVVTPLSLRMMAQPNRQGEHPLLYKVLIYVQPLVTLLTWASYLTPTGLPSAILAGGWLVLTGLAALWGAYRWYARAKTTLAELCLDVGLLYVPVSAVWLIAYRLQYPLLGFDMVIVQLTAVHFTFISLAGLPIAGLVGRQLERPNMLYKAAAVGTLITPSIVAIGITFSRAIEAFGVIVLASSYLLLSTLTLFYILPKLKGWLPKVMLGLSAASLWLTMALAVGYSLGRFTGAWSISLPDMIQWHGWLNSFGFSALGLFGWVLVAPPTKVELKA
jgi:hypothetical protein